MDGALKLWDTNSLEMVTEFSKLPGGVIYDHAMSPSGVHFLCAVATKDCKVVLGCGTRVWH